MMFIPVTGSQLYSGKGICTISLLSLCRKWCKNWDQEHQGWNNGECPLHL